MTYYIVQELCSLIFKKRPKKVQKKCLSENGYSPYLRAFTLKCHNYDILHCPGIVFLDIQKKSKKILVF